MYLSGRAPKAIPQKLCKVIVVAIIQLFLAISCLGAYLIKWPCAPYLARVIFLWVSELVVSDADAFSTTLSQNLVSKMSHIMFQELKRFKSNVFLSISGRVIGDTTIHINFPTKTAIQTLCVLLMFPLLRNKILVFKLLWLEAFKFFS